MARLQRGRGAVALAAACLLVGACTPNSSDTPSPTPLPPVSPTPTENSVEKQERLDYEAAEKSVRTFRSEFRRVMADGGTDTPTSTMRATAAGEYLKEFADIAKAYKTLGYHQTGDEIVSYIHPGAHSENSLLLTICTDGRSVRTVNQENQLIGRGDVRRADIRVRKVGERWKVWSGDGEAVKKC